MVVKDRIEKCISLMKIKKIDYLLIPTSDYHNSENAGDYFKERVFMSGFTGSDGTLVITTKGSYLWVDGRYFIQAAKQIEGSGISLMKMGELGVLDVNDWLMHVLKEKEVLCVDGRVISATLGTKLALKANSVGASIKYDEDLVNEIWQDRPVLSNKPIFLLSEEIAGVSTKQKLINLRAFMTKKASHVYIDNSLDNIMWLLNIRGQDINNCPLAFSYLIVVENIATLYINGDKVKEFLDYFEAINIKIKAYDNFYMDLTNLNKQSVLIDETCMNYTALKCINSTNYLINQKSPIILWKAMKNDIELENLRQCHIKDGVAVTKFMYWLKKNIGLIKLDEISTSEYLEELREQQSFLEPSFDTICAYKANGAMMHYSATYDNFAEIKKSGMLLVDSGGHYLEGTTDITRTFVLGALSKIEMTDFTNSLKGLIALSNQKFLNGCSGINLDILARQALWNNHIDYRCGTGHGVGYLLNVHEGPHGIRWRKTSSQSELETLQKGMVVTVEPGVYKENEYGIRHENELIVAHDLDNEYGEFLKFETITFVPFDLDGIDERMLTKDELNFLNDYHQAVFNKISPFLDEEECGWLKNVTRKIGD